jgi:hypothetical protein
LKRPLRPEKVIEYEILGFLRTLGILCWKTDRQGTYDPVKKTFRANHNPYKITGVSDILALIDGVFIAIEVKSEKGRLTPEQRAFIVKVNENGGIGFVARSLSQVVESLALHFPENEHLAQFGREKVSSGPFDH